MPLRNLSPLLWTLVFLAGSEILLEYRATMRGFSTILFDVHKSASTSEDTGKVSAFGPTSSFPFRSEIVPKEHQPGISRIWIASASHAEDSYLPVTSIFPVQLAQTLSQQGYTAEVLNSSIAGKTISDNTEDFLAGCHMWRPDVVVLYQMSMDISMLSRLDTKQLPVETEKTQKNSISGVLTPPWPTRAVESTTLYSLAKTNLTSRLTNQRLLADRLSNQSLVCYEQSVIQFINTVRENNALPVLCTFAISHSRESDLPGDYWYGVLRASPNLSKVGWLSTVSRLNETLRAIAKREDIPLIDVAALATDHPEYFRDFVHFSKTGHKAVAHIIADTLQHDVFRDRKVILSHEF